MQAGKLRHLVTFQTMDAAEAWTTLKIVRAQVNRTGGSEAHAAGAEQATDRQEFTVRYTTQLAALIPQTTRILFGIRYYEVIEPPDDFMNQHKTLKFRAVQRYGR